MSREIGQEVLRQEADALHAMADRLDDQFDQAVQAVLDVPGRVICCGLGKSGHIARKTSGTLASTGTPSLFLHAAEAAHGDLGMVTDRDVVLLYSYSGESAELVGLLPSLQNIGARLIAMTGRPESSAGRASEIVLNCAVEEEACPNNLAPTTSTTAMLALSDALAVAVMKRREFGSEDFARYHPAGALGRRLTLRVHDVMRQGDDLPLTKGDRPLIEGLRIITNTGAGGLIVVGNDDEMIGYVTDGDVRRHLVDHDDPLQTPVRDLMTENPATLPPDMLAFDALEAFQNHPIKIGEMPIKEKGRAVGLLVLKDLLRSGLV